MEERRFIVDNEKYSTIVTINSQVTHYYQNPQNVYVGKGDYTTFEEINEPIIPDALNNEEAKNLMQRFVDAKMLKEDWYPQNISCTEQALLAKAVCDRLKINDVWQVFASLWKIKPETLRSYFNKSLDQKKSIDFQDRIKILLG